MSGAAASLPPEAEGEGLSSKAAAARLAQFGPNVVADATESVWRALIRQFWAPVPWMLEAAIAVQIGLHEDLEAAVIGGLLVFNAMLSFFQHRRAQAALALLKARLALTASVRRDGAWIRVPAADLVPGDLVKLSLGAVVPADLRLRAGTVLLDQSMLTGESIPADIGAGRPAYAGALVRRGEATGTVTATGARSYFGRTAELVRIAHPESAEQRAIVAVVRNLTVFNGGILAAAVIYARFAHLPFAGVVPFLLTGILASVPVALPATFTLSTALAAQRLARLGVLPTRLSAVHEAASMDVLCSDKTGTLTQNALSVEDVRPMPGFSRARVLALAVLASAEGGQDPVDEAIRKAAAETVAEAPIGPVTRFIPFDPDNKMASAEVAGGSLLVVKGAYDGVCGMTEIPAEAPAGRAALAASGNRVLAVAAGPQGALRLAGLLGLSDPPRADAGELIGALAGLGVRTVMVTGDAPDTAATIARRVGLAGRLFPQRVLGKSVDPAEFDVFAGVFPEDKYRLVQAFQSAGHIVGMCGDGANDAPALRQAQIGIAVASATDVAKAAAAIVLTQPGLGGILEAVREGRATFQRILTYMLNTLIKKIETVLFLAAGLLMTGHAVLTPLLMVLLLVTNDFLTMALSTDRTAAGARPERWRIRQITAAAVALGFLKLAFLAAVLAVGAHSLRLPLGPLRTLAFLALAFGGQATLYVVRQRGAFWRTAPSPWLLASSVADIGIATAIATTGWLTAPLPWRLVLALLGGTATFALLLDGAKWAVFTALRIR